jgi:hypothetical protein
VASVASLKVTKRFTYRGQTKDWSNRYYMDGTTPPNSTAWTTLSDAVTAAEKLIFGSVCSIVETQGYAAGSDVPVFSKTYALAGTLSVAAFVPAPGDCAALVRWSTGARTSKNHPLYLFNYWHNAYISNSTGGDTLAAGQGTAMGTYANAWITGFSDGSVTHHRCGPEGDLATGQTVKSQVYHRDFPSA